MSAGAKGSARTSSSTVLVLADFDFGISDSLVETVCEISDSGAKVILLSGLGDPRADINPAYSLDALAKEFSAACGRPVVFIGDCVGMIAEAGIDMLKPGGIAVLENTRFHRGEMQGERSFANRLALLGDFFVDARAQRTDSIAASARFVPEMMPRLAGATPDEADPTHDERRI